MDTNKQSRLTEDDIAFIQSSYRDAKRKPSQRVKLKDLYPYVTPAEFAELTSTPVADWETSAKKPARAKTAKTAKTTSKPAHDPVLDRLVFRSFDLLVELSRDKEIPIETCWRDALSMLERRMSGKRKQIESHPATEEYELMIAAILTADDLDTKKKCPAGVESEQSTDSK